MNVLKKLANSLKVFFKLSKLNCIPLIGTIVGARGLLLWVTTGWTLHRTSSQPLCLDGAVDHQYQQWSFSKRLRVWSRIHYHGIKYNVNDMWFSSRKNTWLCDLFVKCLPWNKINEQSVLLRCKFILICLPVTQNFFWYSSEFGSRLNRMSLCVILWVIFLWFHRGVTNFASAKLTAFPF